MNANGKKDQKETHGFKIKRHCENLSAKETDDVVSAVADLMVDFISKRGIQAAQNDDKTETKGGDKCQT